jgi:hypothetical protein
MPDPTALRHTVVDGPNLNLMLRQGDVSAHAVVNDGTLPRLLIALAAGNSGGALWFHEHPEALHWTPEGELQACFTTDSQGRVLRGAELLLRTQTRHPLRLRQALVGSVRVLRDHHFDGRLPARGLVAAEPVENGLRWQRDRLDGAPGYRLDLEVVEGRLSGHDIEAGALRLRLRCFSGETPPRAIAGDLLTPAARDLPNSRKTLELLTYANEWLAGSWRFLTYFGRDTLMSLRLLLPVLRPEAAEAGLRSVLARLSPEGRVAHEEDIGEFPILHRLAQGAQPGDAGIGAPMYDYKMVDDDLMLLPVATQLLLDALPERAATFLAQHGEPLARNLRFVLAQTAAFAAEPLATNLIALRPGEIVGDWRDSAEGLAHGRYSYSVNAALAPAALAAAARLMESGLLAAQGLGAEQASQAHDAAAVWQREAPRCFDFQIAQAQAQEAIGVHAQELDVPVPLLSADLQGSALALNALCRPIPVLHSDFGFVLLFSRPSPERLERELQALLRPFPAGLLTDAGLLVANAAQASPELRAVFGPGRYHGAVVWSWQQALFAQGLAEQLKRDDLPEPTRALVRNAQQRLWAVIEATRGVADGELWSWDHDGRRYQVSAFGPKCPTADESNAAQLWSAVYLALTPQP